MLCILYAHKINEKLKKIIEKFILIIDSDGFSTFGSSYIYLVLKTRNIVKSLPFRGISKYFEITGLLVSFCFFIKSCVKVVWFKIIILNDNHGSN